MRMKKKLLLSVLLTIVSTLTSFGKEGLDPVDESKYYELVVVPADTTMGDTSYVRLPEGASVTEGSLGLLKLGYEFDHWESKHGVNLDSINMNDTIIAYFKKLEEFPVVIISSDTTKGTVTADPIYYDYEKIYLHPEPKEGYKFAYWYRLSDTTKKNSGTTLFIEEPNDTIICTFLKNPDYEEDVIGHKYYKFVILTSDSTKGTVDPIVDLVCDGSRIPLSAKPNRGYKLDHWESVNGYLLDYAFGNDTIYAYFDTLPSYDIVAVSNDTSMGLFYGNEIFYEGEKLPQSILVGDVFLTIPYVKIKDGYRLAYYVSKSKGDTIQNINTDYKVTCNDTIVAYFEKYTTPDLGNDTLPAYGGDDPILDTPYAYLNVNIRRINRLDFYGNLLIESEVSVCRGSGNDSIVITNKTTGKNDTISATDRNYKIAFGDTVSFTIITSDDFQSDSVYTIAYTDSSKKYLYETVCLYKQIQKMELEEAEGDSFDVNITYIAYNYNESGSNIKKWEGNGRYAKGTTINVEHDHFLVTNLDEDVIYELPEEMKFVVNNNIELTFISDPNRYLSDVKQIVTEKESVVDPYVNVYSINGYLIKQHVLREEALVGLNKGIYIVGRDKVYVR